MVSDNVGSRLKALDRKALHTTPIISVSWVVGLRKSIRNRVGVGGSERSRGGGFGVEGRTVHTQSSFAC